MGGRPLPGGREPSEAGGAAVLPLRRVDLLLLRVLPSPSLRCVCDRERLLCHSCLDRGLVYTEVARQAEDDVLEISGYHDEEGRFVTLDPPVRMATTSIPRQSDGSFNADELMRLIARSRRVDAAAGPRAA